MRKWVHLMMLASLLAMGLGLPAPPAAGQVSTSALQSCQGLAFSTEEDFVTQGPTPSDGNPIISDGDLLGPNCAICARNRELLQRFDVTVDLGLDAADVIDVERYLVAFSTELDSPNRGQFTAGDLLVTNGVIIPNIALLYRFDIPRADLGLDAVHFIGDPTSIIRFLTYVQQVSRDEWLREPGKLWELLAEYGLDIWFSTEGTAPRPEAPLFLDGDLLSARYGNIVASNDTLLPASVPAGIPTRGVDFGLDGATADRTGNRKLIHFSTEILFEGRPAFTDGDILLLGNGVVRTNEDLLLPCEPRASFLGLDALFIAARQVQATGQDAALASPAAAPVSKLEVPVASLEPSGAPLQSTDPCAGLVFSTEEDFVTQGPEPPDGNPIISDGDLLGANCALCARNRELLRAFQVTLDLGLDAADVIDAQAKLVAFSTSLDSPSAGQFTAGDLLATNGAAIPNIALTYRFQVGYDVGLDGVQFIGPPERIASFLAEAARQGRDFFLQRPEALAATLREAGLDIWFSTEGTVRRAGAPGFLDGDLLSAATGAIVASNDVLLPASVPAGIPDRGVDFGLDAVGNDRSEGRASTHFSTEILYDGRISFTDGDVLLINNGVVHTNRDLIQPCEPRASFLGLDAFSLGLGPCRPSVAVDKKVLDPRTGAWVEEIEAQRSTRVKFRCRITNDGQCCTLRDLVIQDILGDSLEYVDNATVNGIPREPDTVIGNELTWLLPGPLAPGQSLNIEFEAHVRDCGRAENVQRVTAVCEDGTAVTAADNAYVTAVGKPDLVISSIICDRANNRLGYVVENVGCQPAPQSHYTGLWVAGQQVCRDHVTVDLPPGASHEGWFDCYDWPWCTMLDEVKVCADIVDPPPGRVDESNEDNNCRGGGCISAALEWTWNATSTMPDYDQVMMAPVVADLNADNIPDIVFTTYKGSNYISDGILRAIRGSDGAELFSITDPDYRVEPGGDPAVADIDNDGRPEIIANKDPEGIICFEHDGAFKWLSPTPSLGGGGVAIADLDEDGRPEIIAGKTVLNNDGTVRWTGSGGSISHAAVANLDMSGHPEVLCGRSVYRYDGTVYWTGTHSGRPAVANFDRDAFPEVVIVGGDQISMWEHDGTLKWGPVPVPTTGNGPPVIADFDGDGVPEIGVGGYDAYVVFESNLAVKWIAEIRDHSSRAASSTAFDIDLDGAFEIVYSDELFHRIFRGSDGAVLFQVPGPSGTLTEQPAIADVDNDNHVELIFAVNNYAFPGNTGIEVWGNDRCWPPARPIWNQHTYHITNIRDDAKVPQVEDNNWETHNNYRTQAPPALVERKPDLVITRILCDRANNRVGYVIRNGGDAPASAGHDTALYVNGTFMCTDEVTVNLAPGATHTAWFDCYTWPSQPCTAISVEACADRGNEVDEKDETNNCTTDRCSCNRVYFEPQDSGTSYCNRTPVDIRVQATGFKAGQIKLKYDPSCADVVNWVPAPDFPLASWDSDTTGEEWITFSALAAMSGDYKVGTLYIHCVSEADCMTVLDFVVNGTGTSKLFDDGGAELAAAWEDGTFSCTRGKCGDVAPYPGCNNIIDMGDVALLHSYVGHPGQYSLCCEPCGDVAPVPQCNGVIDMGDVALLHSYVGHPGQYNLCCEPSTAADVEMAPALSMQSNVTLVPVASSAPYTGTTQVQIRVNGSNFKAGQIKLTYQPSCAEVVDWVGNSTDFPLTSSDSTTAGQEWITFSAMSALTGDYLIGTLTIRCESQATCSTALDFVESGAQPCKLFDDWGAEIAATWHDGTFSCGEVANKAYLPVIMKKAQP